MSRRPNTNPDRYRSRLESVLTAGLANEEFLVRTRFLGSAREGVTGQTPSKLFKMMIPHTIQWGTRPPTGETLGTVVEFTTQKLDMLRQIKRKAAQLPSATPEELAQLYVSVCDPEDATLQEQTVHELMGRFLPIEGSVPETQYDPNTHKEIISEALFSASLEQFELNERVLFLLYAKLHHVDVVLDVKRNARHTGLVADGMEDTIQSWISASQFKAGVRFL